ncbi:six-hairpin glycosidase [Autumnicola musiva]|uniref:Six-hairpin glycosidase n=1 Tax=Autumnicola musiva TaxID=3075589 RepID=A0ABU3D7Q6_9FLAO|nr:six-hairpin glycosidase [Zunongwangia sp. F117]MDT0677566.1 six-hairpin glycosidase [Zunongwangia sp. F117]
MRLNSENLTKIAIAVCFGLFSYAVLAQDVDTVKYVGSTLSNIDYHHGQLRPAVGVHARQIMRASREHPQSADYYGWTYNHAPNLAYWDDTFFVQYLSNPVGEHIPPGQSYVITSEDGKNWGKPEVLFPVYPIPDGYKKEGHPATAKDLTSVMHQRMGFYVSSGDKLLALGYYGIAMDEHDSPNDGNGIGRVVREIYDNGSFGPIYFIRYNKNWDQSLSEFPFYKESDDEEFIQACEELLTKPLMMQQWVEEQDRDDPLIPLQEQFKAFSYYHLPDDRVVGLWKHALTSISLDGGETWKYHPLRAPGFVNKNAKIWGQETSDGNYATVYNPSEFRWPLAVSTSEDGIVYNDLLLIHGEISTMRYGGNYKSWGPQYVRGILEGNGTPPDGKMWVTYSMNKEDIWVASVPVPITANAESHADEVFNLMPDGEELKYWNIYDLEQAPVKIEKSNDQKWLALKDKDAYDYARVERIIPTTKNLEASFTIRPEQNDHGKLQVEFQNEKGQPAVRLIFDENGELKAKAGYRYSKLADYEAGENYRIDVRLEPETRSYTVQVNGGDEKRLIFYAPVHEFERIMFRTGDQRYEPTPESPAANHEDLENPGKQIPEAAFYIKGLKTGVFSK